MPDFFTRRNGTWHFVRRVPLEFAAIDGRGVVRHSTKVRVADDRENLQPGDSIEAEIEGVGVLRNHVVPWAAAHSTPPYSTDLYSSTG